MFDRAKALAANERGRRLQDRGMDEAAELEFLKAVDLDSGCEAAWFNLGLIYKHRHDWAACARCNLRAAELDSAPGQPAWWNLGIAATALRDWEVARRAWRGFGIDLPDGSGPVEANFGRAPVRLAPQGAAEVVWCRRIDPARAVIENVPMPQSAHRHGDVVLHDGAPNGERVVEGRVYGVFDELEIWQESDMPTATAQLHCPVEADAAAVAAMFDTEQLATEDWTGGVRMLCKACSEGRPHRDHDLDGTAGWQPNRSFGFAAPAERAAKLLERWVAAGAGRRFDRLERAL